MRHSGGLSVLDWRGWGMLAILVALQTVAWGQVSTSQAPTAAQHASDVPSTAAQLAQFVPPGWVLEQKKVADLNGDGRADALLLMRKSNSGDAPERILAVVLRRSGDHDGYMLAELNSRLIPHSDNATLEDPMADGELVAQRGGFEIKLMLMAGVGSYQMATLKYRFRYQDGCFRLIGFDRLETNRATLDTRDLSINFLTGLVVHRTGNAQSSATEKHTETLKTNPRRCFGELDSAAAFNPQ